MLRNSILGRRVGRLAVAAAAIVVAACMQVGAQNDPQAAVNAAFNKFKTLKEGKNADYIPALAKVDPNLFGIALVTTDGKVYSAGDLTTEVSIQSISKVFTMAYVMQQSGKKALEDNMGVDATGQVFMMLMNGGAIAAQALVYVEPNLAWKIVAQGDYNGDGKADILWRNDSTGLVYMMLMSGLAIASQAVAYEEPNTAWKLLGPWEYAQ